MNTRLLLAAAAAIIVPAALGAGTAEPVADTFVMARDIGIDAVLAEGTKKALAIKSDKPGSPRDRLGVLRFEVPADSEFGSAKLTLHLRVQRNSATSGTFELYGVLPGASEDDLDETTYTAAKPDSAVDASGNRLKEQFVHDPDPESDGIQPLATAVLADGDATIVFKGEALVNFLQQVDDGDVAFILRAALAEERGGTPSTFFHSREAKASVRPTLSWD
jgi:hypothetical protein